MILIVFNIVVKIRKLRATFYVSDTVIDIDGFMVFQFQEA